MGCDTLYEQHEIMVKENFLLTKGMKKERERCWQEEALVISELHDCQLSNSWMMQRIDDQVDKKMELEIHVGYLKKDVLTTQQRQQNYMHRLFELYKTKQREMENLHQDILISRSYKAEITMRRDGAFFALSELFDLRRQMMGFVSDQSHAMSEIYSAKVEANNTRRDGQDLIEETTKIWSSKIEIPKQNHSLDNSQLSQIMKELDLKQNQILTLVAKRDYTQASNKLIIQKNNVQGKFGMALDTLLDMTKESE